LEKKSLMTIEITKPEIEALIIQRLQSGGFRDAQDVILQALQGAATVAPPSGKRLEVGTSVRGTADDINSNHAVF
jgi:hypothetical protein